MDPKLQEAIDRGKRAQANPDAICDLAAALLMAWDSQGVQYHQLADRSLLLAVRALREALWSE